jgi:hypothetical protein
MAIVHDGLYNAITADCAKHKVYGICNQHGGLTPMMPVRITTAAMRILGKGIVPALVRTGARRWNLIRTLQRRGVILIDFRGK